MERDEAKVMRRACKYLIDNLEPLEGKEINRLGADNMQKIKGVWERAMEICPEISGTTGVRPTDISGRFVNLCNARERLSIAEEYIHLWDAVDTSPEVQEYLDQLKILKEARERMEAAGFSQHKLSLMGLI